MILVLVTEPEYRKAEEVFAGEEGFECVPVPYGEAALAERVRAAGAKYVVIGVEKYVGPLYDALPRGGVIARFGVGHDGVDKRKAAERGVVCANTPGVLDQSVAECAIGLMLCAARGLPVLAADTRRGEWKGRVGRELSGRTVAIIGCGAIGGRTASIAALGLGMRVIGFVTTERAREPERGVERYTTDFADAVANADYVSVHLPSNAITKDFINGERLAQMQRRSVLINTARGGVVDEDALYDAIVAGQIAGAALDVFKAEPYAPQSRDKDLRTLDRVIMTPHIGSSTEEACGRMARAALRNIAYAEAGDYDRMSLVR